MGRRGMTLIELVVVCLMVGILAAMAIPQYMRTVEAGKADAAALMLRRITNAQKKFAIDHGGLYFDGLFTLSACGPPIEDPACPNPFPTTVPAGHLAQPCFLSWCNYLPEFSRIQPYAYRACDPAQAGTCGTTGLIGQAVRMQGASPGTSDPEYQGWGLDVLESGRIVPVGGAPEPLN